MKLVLAGSSGFIGQEVLQQCLQNPSITSLVALSRRELAISNPKLKTVIVKDFQAYEPAVLRELEGAVGCIWTLGVKTSDVDIQRKVTIDYTLAAVSAFASPPTSLLEVAAGTTKPGEKNPSPRSQPFRFVFASGVLAVSDQSKSLWLMAAARHVKGDIENKLLDFSAQHGEALDAFIVRPGYVMASSGTFSAVMAGMGLAAVGLQSLAAVMVELALRGAKEKVWENAELSVRGRELLKVEHKR